MYIFSEIKRFFVLFETFYLTLKNCAYILIYVLFLPFTYPFNYAYIPEYKHFLSFISIPNNLPWNYEETCIFIFSLSFIYIYTFLPLAKHFLPLLNVSLNPKIRRIHLSFFTYFQLWKDFVKVNFIYFPFFLKSFNTFISPPPPHVSPYHPKSIFSFATFTTLFRWYASKLSFAVLRFRKEREGKKHGKIPSKSREDSCNNSDTNYITADYTRWS